MKDSIATWLCLGDFYYVEVIHQIIWCRLITKLQECSVIQSFIWQSKTTRFPKIWVRTLKLNFTFRRIDWHLSPWLLSDRLANQRTWVIQHIREHRCHRYMSKKQEHLTIRYSYRFLLERLRQSLFH